MFFRQRSQADIVIAQVNKRMPFTLGEAVLPLSAFDYPSSKLMKLCENFRKANRMKFYENW